MEKQKSKLRTFSIILVVVMVLATGAYLVGFRSVEATETKDKQQASSEQQEQQSESKDAEKSKSDSEQKGEDAKSKSVPVELTTVETGSVSAFISASANLVPENDVKVLAEAEGRIADIAVEEGDRVRGEQALATLVRDEAEILMNKARLRATNAELAFERAKETLEQGLIAREEYDRLQMEHEVAQQEVAEAKWTLSKTTIRAPFAGRITERFVKPGQHVRPGDVLFAVADFDPLIAYLYLPEKDVLQLQEGRPVRITLAADASYRFDGKIRQISPVVDTATGTVKVTVEAMLPPAKVRPGAFVNVDIVKEQRNDVVLIPRESVIRELRNAHVFVRNGDEAAKRSVTLGLEEGDKVEVLSGVQAGDEVIVAGQGGLKDGAKIKAL